MKWVVHEMSSELNDELIKQQNNVITGWWNGKFMKWQANEMTSKWNDNLLKWQNY
jgi:hypothetical protein